MTIFMEMNKVLQEQNILINKKSDENNMELKSINNNWRKQMKS